jgi:glycerol-3-phosphate dehydrogenase subunit B
MSTGALDIAFAPALSRVHQEPRTVAEHVMDIAAHRRRHPYAVLGIERAVPAIRRGFDLLREVLAPAELAPPSLDLEAENHHLPSALGVVFPAASALSSHLGVDLGTPLAGRWGVIQLEGHAPFDAERVVAGLAADAEAMGHDLDLTPIVVPWQGSAPPLVLARGLDDQARADELAAAVAARAAGYDGLILPPILGLDRSGAVRRTIELAAGAQVVEALGYMPSVPGARLARALEAAVSAAGIEWVGEVSETRSQAGRVRSVVTRDRIEITAGGFVLASGRFIAGGLSWHESCREPLFDLPVITEDGLMEDDSPHPVVRDTPMESHPLMTAGIQVRPDLRPVREGQLAYENLFAAGMVIGGFASRYALCADGVALATGYLAGRTAAGAKEEAL